MFLFSLERSALHLYVSLSGCLTVSRFYRSSWNFESTYLLQRQNDLFVIMFYLSFQNFGHFWGLFRGYGRQTKSSVHRITSIRVLTVLALVNWTKANLTGSQSASPALHFTPFSSDAQRNQTSLNGLSKARFTGSWRVDMSGFARELNNTCYIPACGRLPPLRSGDTPIIKLNCIPSFNANNTFRPGQCIRRGGQCFKPRS